MIEKMTGSLACRLLRNGEAVATSLQHCKVSYFDSAMVLLLKGHSNFSSWLYSWCWVSDIFFQLQNDFCLMFCCTVLAICGTRKLDWMLKCPSSVACELCIHLNERGLADSLASWTNEDICTNAVPTTFDEKSAFVVSNIINNFAGKRCLKPHWYLFHSLASSDVWLVCIPGQFSINISELSTSK